WWAELLRRRVRGSPPLRCALSANYLKIGAQLGLHHLFERKVFGCVPKAVTCALRGQIRIGNKFQDRQCQCLSIPWFNEQTVLAIANNFWNIANFRSDHRPSAGETPTQNDGE